MGLDPSHQDRCEQDRADACPPCRTASARARSASLTQKVREKTGVDDWKFESYVPADGKVTFTREDFMVEVLEVEYTGGGTAKRRRRTRRVAASRCVRSPRGLKHECY